MLVRQSCVYLVRRQGVVMTVVPTDFTRDNCERLDGMFCFDQTCQEHVPQTSKHRSSKADDIALIYLPGSAAMMIAACGRTWMLHVQGIIS